jgi:hypothetical protein
MDDDFDYEATFLEDVPINEWIPVKMGNEFDCPVVELDACRDVLIMLVVEEPGRIAEIRIKPRKEPH